MNNIPFMDLVGQYRCQEEEILTAIRSVLESGEYILGKELTRFEDDFARFCGTKFGIGVDSGISALELSLKALGIGPGDEVIIPAQTFIATASAVSFSGATPVLVDIDDRYYTIDPEKIEAAVTPRTKAVIPVHLYGQTAEMGAISRIAVENELAVIEDAAQAHGARYKEARAGASGDVGCFSFYPAKNLGAFGDGGIVVTDSNEIREKIRMLRNYGQAEKYRHVFLAFNRRLDSLQAAVLRVKLKQLEIWNQRRREIADIYRKNLQDLPLVLPQEAPYSRHVYHLFVVLTTKRNELKKSLREQGVATGLHYPLPIHLQEAYRDLSYARGNFPVAERVADQCLSLPLYPNMKKEDSYRTIEAIRNFFKA